MNALEANESNWSYLTLLAILLTHVNIKNLKERRKYGFHLWRNIEWNTTTIYFQRRAQILDILVKKPPNKLRRLYTRGYRLANLQ